MLHSRVLLAIRMLTVSDNEQMQELYQKLREGTTTESDLRCSSLFPAAERDRGSGREIYSSDTRDRSRSTGNNNCDVLPQRKHILARAPYKQTAAAMCEILGDVESVDGLKEVCHIAYGRPNVTVVQTRGEFSDTERSTPTVKTIAVMKTMTLITDNLHYDQLSADGMRDGQYGDTSLHNDTAWQTKWVPAELANMKMNRPDYYMWRPHETPGTVLRR